MDKNSQLTLRFPGLHGKDVVADFDGGTVTSEAGLLFVKEIERNVGIIRRIVTCIPDGRDHRYIEHTMNELVRQRVMQICCGYEDADDSDSLRRDPAVKIACGRLPLTGGDLGSQPTISRLENAVSRTTLYRIAQGFVDCFLDSYRTTPRHIILDIDDTDDPTHGAQQMSLFNAYYDEYCYLPLHIYEGHSGKLILSVLRPGKRPTGMEVASILRRVVARIRRRWPRTRILVRADSHFSGPEMFVLCRQYRLKFVLGLTGNTTLLPVVDETVRTLEYASKVLGEKVKTFVELSYQAGSWPEPQRVICKIEVNEQGRNIRFIVTNLTTGTPRRVYDKAYCGRGRMENFITDHKNALHSDRTSCHRFEANQFRLFLHSAAYVLLHALTVKGLRNTPFSGAQFDTIIRLVMKIGAVVVERLSNIRIHLPTSSPVQALYGTIYRNLGLGVT